MSRRLAPWCAPLFLALAGPIGPVAAADDCPGDGTQIALNECAGQALKAAEATLASRLEEIRARLDALPERAAALDAAQSAWEAYRDAECGFAASGVEGGSIQPLVLADCARALTQTRIEALSPYLACEEGDTECPVPPA